LESGKCSRQLEILCPIDSETLVVLRRREAKLDRIALPEDVDWKEVTAIDFWAIRSKSVDLVG
jgi:hypothetical protein